METKKAYEGKKALMTGITGQVENNVAYGYSFVCSTNPIYVVVTFRVLISPGSLSNIVNRGKREIHKISGNFHYVNHICHTRAIFNECHNTFTFSSTSISTKLSIPGSGLLCVSKNREL